MRATRAARAIVFLFLVLVCAPAQAEYALGARVRGIWVTPAMMAPFLTTSTLMQNPSFGVELIQRRPHYDVVTSIDVSLFSPADGNYLASGHDPNVDSHFVHFDNLTLLSTDVSIIGHTALNRWLELRYGAGVGLGLVLGGAWVVNNGGTGANGQPICTAQNAGDISQCHPVGVDLTSPDRQKMLDATKGPGTDLAGTPHYHQSNEVPPVLPVVNILVGLSARVHRHASLQVEVGFRNAIFFGIGGHYWF